MKIIAFSIFEKLGNRQGMADSLNALARTYFPLGSFDKALENNITALKIWEELGDTKKSANILFNIGTFYATIKESNQALEYYSRAGIRQSLKKLDAPLEIRNSKHEIRNKFE